jgi:YHS domain-containing protein
MKRFVLVGFACSIVAMAETPSATREALKPLNVLVGTWKGTGQPEGTPEERQRGHWIETVSCEWKFKEADVWIAMKFEKGKHFTSGELRAKDAKFEAKILDVDGKQRIYSGELKDKTMTLERPLTDDKQIERIVFSLLHDNRVLYRLETRPESGTIFTKKYQVGLTKEGVPFANSTDVNECIVSGGKGTSTVSFEGKTYYVCCSGCRDEFKADPAKYVKEWEAKRKK